LGDKPTQLPHDEILTFSEESNPEFRQNGGKRPKDEQLKEAIMPHSSLTGFFRVEKAIQREIRG
jgi:hypothetical protein